MLPVTGVEMRSLRRQRPVLVDKVQSHYHRRVPTDMSFVSIRNIRNESYLIRNRPFLCVPVLIVYIWWSVTCFYISQ